MTTAIEQAKREMYNLLSSVMQQTSHPTTLRLFEAAMESYLEQLRQQYEEMASTAHQRFESIQSMESVNQDLIDQLAKMTESRDMFRNLHQAATHAAIGHAGVPRTSGQDSGERASCEQPDAKTMAILGAVVDAQRIVTDWGMGGIKAKNAMRKIAGVVHGPTAYTAVLEFEGKPIGKYPDWKLNNDKCMHSFFAIGDDQMKCTFCGVEEKKVCIHTLTSYGRCTKCLEMFPVDGVMYL